MRLTIRSRVSKNPKFTSSVATNFTGFKKDTKGTWYYFKNGKIAWNYFNLAQGSNGVWYFVNGGYIDKNVTGLAFYNNAWFYVEKGQVNWKANTLAKNKHGWWKVTNGMVDFNFTGLFKYKNMWYYLKNGKIDRNYKGLVQGASGKWYYVQKGKIDWDYSGTPYYNGQYWKVSKGRMTSVAKFINKGGSKGLKSYFGISRTQFVNFLYKKEAKYNYNYYLNTPYVGLGSWDTAHTLFYVNGKKRSDGFSGMNCGSFVAVATRDAGCNLSSVYQYSELSGTKAYTGLAKASAWYKFAMAKGVKWRAYKNKHDLLADGWAKQGDLVYCRPDYEHGQTGDVHIGIYWGTKKGEDLLWHSFPYKNIDNKGNRLGNLIGPLTSPAPCVWYVYKWD